MIAPVAVRWLRRNLADERMRSPSGPAKKVTSKSAEVFNPTEIEPRITNCQKT